MPCDLLSHYILLCVWLTTHQFLLLCLLHKIVRCPSAIAADFSVAFQYFNIGLLPVAQIYGPLVVLWCYTFNLIFRVRKLCFKPLITINMFCPNNAGLYLGRDCARCCQGVLGPAEVLLPGSVTSSITNILPGFSRAGSLYCSVQWPQVPGPFPFQIPRTATYDSPFTYRGMFHAACNGSPSLPICYPIGLDFYTEAIILGMLLWEERREVIFGWRFLKMVPLICSARRRWHKCDIKNSLP